LTDQPRQPRRSERAVVRRRPRSESWVGRARRWPPSRCHAWTPGRPV